MKKLFIISFFLMSFVGMLMAGWVVVYMHPKPAAKDHVVFGQRNGEDLTFEVITPKKSNGLALVFIVCGDWESISMHDYNVRHTAAYVQKGFTIFKLYHVSQPQASVPETVEDCHRGVRYVRLNAKRWNIDPNRIGLYGRSSGGQLALCVALKSDDGDPTSDDPVEQQSSHVQACGVFYPLCELTELDEHDHPGDPSLPEQINFGENAATDPEKWQQIAYEMSPIHHIHSNMPPIMISHGDADVNVPIEQPLLFVELAKKANAPPVNLFINPGKTHHYDRRTMFADRFRFAKWFDKTLNPQSKD